MAYPIRANVFGIGATFSTAAVAASTGKNGSIERRDAPFDLKLAPYDEGPAKRHAR